MVIVIIIIIIVVPATNSVYMLPDLQPYTNTHGIIVGVLGAINGHHTAEYTHKQQYYYIMCKECVSSSRPYHDATLLYVSNGQDSVGGRPGVPSIHYLRRYPNAPPLRSRATRTLAAI